MRQRADVNKAVGGCALNRFFNVRGWFQVFYKVFFEAPLGLDDHEAVCYVEEKRVGKLTSLIFSPKYNKYLGFVITKKINFIGEKEIFIKIKNGMFKASVESLD